jgi:hypothetical protein
MTPRLPSVLSPADLPTAELYSARLDGDLVGVADCFVPVDIPQQAADRAQSFAHQVPDRVIVELLSAAWVFGAITQPPSTPQFCSASDARAKPATLRRLSIREVVIDDDEVVRFGGVRVTSPLRTACDLVRSSDDFDADLQLVVLRLLQFASASVVDCMTLLGRRRNLPGKKRTLYRLRCLARSADSAVADPVNVVYGVDAPHGVQHSVQVRGVAHFEHELAEREAVR